MSTEMRDIVERVRADCLAVDGVDPLDEAAELRLRADGFHNADVDRHGFALEYDGELTLAVAPDSRGRGVGTRLLGLAQEYADRAWSHGDHPAARRLASAHGWVPARELWVMRRPTRLPLPDHAPPEGVRIRSYEPGDDTALLEVNAAAFADHPEQGGLDAAGLRARRAEPWFDPDGLLIAVEADGEHERMLGFHWTKQHGPGVGEVYVVGVSPAAQGRGLGRVLTVAGLAHLAARDVDEVMLYVEADNDPARTLYERLGFSHASTDTHVQFRRSNP